VPSSEPGGDLGGGGTVVQPPPPTACADTFAPTTAIDRARFAASRAGLTMRGAASDRGCGGLRRVQTSFAHHEPGGCRWLGAGAKLGPLTSCRRPVWIDAKGRSPWVARVKRTLPRGTWVARSRAFDGVGNVEIKRRLSGRKRNFLKFVIR
jgi:hypothetical protein